jgi:hypothetical protein
MQQVQARSHFKSYRLQDQLEYWRAPRDAAQSKEDTEHIARCRQFIEQCDRVAALAGAASVSTARHGRDA